MDFATARINMVESQLRTNKVTDERVLDAMREVPRESFVPANMRDIAYIDEEVKIADGRYIMEPMILARMAQISQIGADDSVLVVGSASGYMAAVVGKLASSVFAIESNEELVTQSEALLTDMAMDNIVVQKGDLKTGCPKQGPYNVIIIDGGVDQVPDTLLSQLAEDGRLIACVNQNELVSVVTIYKNKNGHVSQTKLFDANVANLTEFAATKEFAL